MYQMANFQNFDSNGASVDVDFFMASPSGNSNSNSGLPSLASNGGSSNQLPNTMSTNTGSNSKGNNVSENQPTLTKPRLLELVREVDSTAQLDEDVEELLLQMADDFIEDAVKATCSYAKHRRSSKVEVRDVQLHLERKWNMWIPGFGTDELRPYKRAAVTEAHKQRLALIRKTIKKY